MKTKKYSLIILLLFAVTTFAQGRFKEKMEQVKSLKVAFITNELQLTPEESAKFWPIYNAYEEKQRELRKQKVNAYIDRRDQSELEKMSEKEAAALLTQMEDNEAQLYEARKKFITSLKGVIPAVKILKLKRAEEEFNRKLLQQYRNKRKQ